MSTVDVKRLWDRGEIKLFNREKEERLKELMNSVKPDAAINAACDRVPYPSFAHAQFLQMRREDNLISATSLSAAKRNGHISRTHADVFVEKLEKMEEVPDALQLWAALVRDRAVTWKRVEKVSEAGVQDCWDITVPGPYTFVTVAGTVVQDTMSFWPVVSKAAVKEAREKMAPEKNLISIRGGSPNFVPSQEYLEALFIMSDSVQEGKPKVFDTEADMLEALRKGEIHIDDPVDIREET
jgi:hypothetical protein